MPNKITFGLQDVHFATFTESAGTITYDAPVKIPGGVELSLEPRGDMVEFYADNMLYYSAQNNQGYDGTLSVANIPQEFAESVLGESFDATDMVLTEKSNVQGKSFALLFQFEGDVKATRHVLYNCAANRPTVASSTRTDSVEPNANELTFVASPRSTDYVVKRKTTDQTPQATYDAWFTAVYDGPSGV